MSLVTCQYIYKYYYYFFLQSDKASRLRVCYQGGLPRLVSILIRLSENAGTWELNSEAKEIFRGQQFTLFFWMPVLLFTYILIELVAASLLKAQPL